MAFARSTGQPSTLQQIGTGLSAFGAGVQGRGPEFLALQQQQSAQLDDDRKRGAADDIRRAKLFHDRGDVASIVDLATNRIAEITRLGGDPADTQGLLGLSLFVSIFLSLLLNIRKAKRFAGPLGDDYVRLGQSLLAILTAILVIIGTSNRIDYIPYYYWALAGVAAGYINMVKQAQEKSPPEHAGEHTEV